MVKPFTLNKKSWHYVLANRFTVCGVSEYYEDICSYTRKVFVGIFWATITFAISLLVLASSVDFLVWVFVTIKEGIFFAPDNKAILGITITGLIILGLVMFGFIKTIDAFKKFTGKQNSIPSFIALAHHSFKDKFCVKITFE